MTTLVTPTDDELDALERGLARIYRGRVIPVMRGGADDDDADDQDDDTGSDDADDQDDDDSSADDDGDDQLSKAQARKLRRENQKLRARAKAAEADKTKRDRDELSERDKAKAELQEERDAKARLESENRRLLVESLAARAGSIDPESVAAAVDWDELGDEPTRDDLTEAIKAVKKRKPHLFGAKKDDEPEGKARGSADGGAGKGKSSGKTPDDEDVTPGVGRLRRYYETATTKEK